jgi:hypothetical protein
MRNKNSSLFLLDIPTLRIMTPYLVAGLTAKPTIVRKYWRTSENCSASTMPTRTNVSKRRNNQLAPSVNDRLILASFGFSNTAVPEKAVQQPVQQRRRASAIKNITLRTENSRFKHKKNKCEHQRTTLVESPFGSSEYLLRTPP